MSKKDEEAKKEVLKTLENKKYTKKEVKEKLVKFNENIDLKELIEKEKIQEFTFLNRKYKCKKENLFIGDIDNSKNKKDKVKLIINRIKITDYFRNKKIKKIKKLCHQNVLVAQKEIKKTLGYKEKNNGILKNHYAKSIINKKTVYGFIPLGVLKKKSNKEIKETSNMYKNLFIEHIKDVYLKGDNEDEANNVLKILNDYVLNTTDKNGVSKPFLFKPCDYELFKGYTNFKLYGSNLGEILERQSDFNLIIGADTEFINVVGGGNSEECVLLSCQYCFYWSGYIYTFTFIMNKIYSSKLGIKTFIQHILKYIDTHLFKINERDKETKKKLNITILHHFGRADLQHFNEFYKIFYKGQALQIQSGIDTIRPLKLDIRYQNRGDRKELLYKVNLTLRDTMGYSTGNKSLARQSSEQFFKKIDDKEANKNDMLSYLIDNTKNFIDYADMDAVATLELGYKLWGFNSNYPLTIGQHSVNCYINSYIENILGTTIVNAKSLYRFLYNGSFKSDTVTDEDDNGKLQKTDVYSHTNINITNNLSYYANSYHGGLNQCYTRGFYNNKTLDFDLTSAYPTFMSCLPEVNYTLPFREFYNISSNEALDLLQDYKEFNLATAVVDFNCSFAKNERYRNRSCIGQKIKDNLVFAKTGNNVCVCGAELYRALEQGIITKIEKLIIPNYLEKNVFDFFYKKTIKLRNEFKRVYGKKSVQQEAIKSMNNTPYGKTSQGVSNSKVCLFINKVKSVKNMPSCDMTNPIYASCITSLVRCYLNDVIALLSSKGYIVHSVTTDGFITSLTDVKILDEITQKDEIIGVFTNRILSVAREIQYNKDLNSIWEVKHSNDSLFNITTRGNFSMSYSGVLACAGAKLLKSFKNRSTIVHYLLKNNGKVQDKFLKLTTLTEMLINGDVLSGVYIYKDNYYIEFDGKNIPELETAELVEIEIKNVKYKVLNFKTRQPNNIEEFLLMKKLLTKYRNATYNIESFYRLMQEFKTNETLEIERKVNSTRSTKNIEYTVTKNFLTNYINNTVSTAITDYFTNYTRQEIIDFLNINFLSFNNKKLTKNVFENIQKKIKKDKVEKLEDGDIELKILEHIKNIKK